MEYNVLCNNRFSLDSEAVKAIESILSAEKTAELTVRNGKLIIWETRSKKKYESTVAIR